MADKIIKVELTVERDGRKFTKTLEGEDADKWQRWTDGVCFNAWNHGVNPAWETLNWQETEVEQP